MKRKTLFSNDITSPQKYLDNLLIQYQDIFHECLSVAYNNKISNIGPYNSLRYLFESDISGKNKCIRDLLIEAFLSAEKKFPGAGILTLLLLTNKEIKNIPHQERCSSAVAAEFTKKYFVNKTSADVFQQLLKHSGSDSRIRVSESKSLKNTIELKSGYRFCINLDPTFFSMIPNQEIFLNNCKIIIIDGAPQSVGEINHILEWAHESGQGIMLVAKNFPEEIIATLATNWTKRTLNVLPVKINNEIEAINTIADLSVVLNCTPVSPVLGDLISNIIPEEAAQVNKIYASNKEIIINHIGNEGNIFSHIRNLLIKIDNTDIADKKEYLVTRIASLSPNFIEVKLSDKNKNLFCIKEELDLAIKLYSEICSGGIVKYNYNYGWMEKLKSFGFDIIPYRSLITAIKTRNSLVSSLRSIGGYIIADESKSPRI